MVYSEEFMKFWNFHGKALRFMSGAKSVGQVIDGSTSKGLYDPQRTSINFAVPNVNSVNNFDALETNIPKTISPGIITQTQNVLPRDKTYVLSVDGKKGAPGLSDLHGDQDLFGHEEKHSLQSLKDRLQQELQEVESLKTEWSFKNNEDRKVKALEIVRIISSRTQDVRLLYQNQKFTLAKFHKEAGEDWRKSRFIYVISSVQSIMYQIKSVLKRLLEMNNMLLQEVAVSCNSCDSFSFASEIDQYEQKNWISLKDQDCLPESLRQDTRLIKQRTEQWLEERSHFKLTGSTPFAGLGLDSLKNLQKHYNKVVRKRDTGNHFC
jgi:hypothetical protein